MKKTSFLTKDNIVLNLDAKSKTEAIKKLSHILQKNGVVSDAEQFSKDVLAREKIDTTGIGKNIAIPHGKSKAVNSASLIFAKNKYPLDWQSLDGSKVKIIFLMAVRADDKGKEHLKMLAHISGKLMDDKFVAQLKKENDPQKLLEIITK